MHDIRPRLPELFKKPGNLLYIGARLDAHSWLEELYQAGNTITVLEVWPENARSLIDLFPVVAEVIIGDVRDIQAETIRNGFDYVFWWHGPEHIDKQEVGLTLAKLEQIAIKTVVVASPWGLYPQGEHKGNLHEIHRWSVYPADLQAWGYTVVMDGQRDQPGSEVVGWKRRSGNIVG